MPVFDPAWICRAAHTASRPTIGLLLTNQTWTLLAPQWAGVLDGAREQDVNLVCYAGGGLRAANPAEARANFLYDLVSARRLDGLVIWTGGLNWYVSPEEMTHFCHRWSQGPAPLPMVSIEAVIEGIPSLLVDDAGGIQLAMEHLINVHGYRRIAFLRGPAGHLGIQARYQSYLDSLARAGIPFDPGRVSEPVDDWDGEAALNRMLYVHESRQAGTFGPLNAGESRQAGTFGPLDAGESRQAATFGPLDAGGFRQAGAFGPLNAGGAHVLDFQAVIGASDGLALGAMRALKARGLRIPEDAAVIGFDNQTESASVAPPLTSVLPPFYDLARRAIALVLDQLAGRPVPRVSTVPCRLILRQSCGCGLQALAEMPAGPSLPEEGGPQQPVQRELRAQAERAGFVQSALEAQGWARSAASAGLAPDWAGELWDALLVEPAPAAAAPETAAADPFYLALEQAIQHMAEHVANGIVWQNVLSRLWARALPVLQATGDAELFLRAESRIQQGRVLATEFALRQEMARRVRADARTAALHAVSQELISTFELSRLMDVLAERLPELGIRSCYLALFENPKNLGGPARLMLAFNQPFRAALPPEGLPFDPPDLLPPGVLASGDGGRSDRGGRSGRYAWMVRGLYFLDEPIGLVVFGADLREISIYEMLRGQISSAVKGALLFEQRRRNEQLLEQANEQLRARMQEIEQLQEVLHEQSVRDPLTGLYNRRYLTETLAREIARAGRENFPLSIVMADIDYFKKINDRFGHGVGDKYLVELAGVIRKSVRASDIVCRYGGEEFLLVLPDATLERAIHRAEEIRQKCAELILRQDGEILQTSLSFGVAAYPTHGQAAEEIIEKADKALYRSKKEGRNKVTGFS